MYRNFNIHQHRKIIQSSQTIVIENDENFQMGQIIFPMLDVDEIIYISSHFYKELGDEGSFIKNTYPDILHEMATKKSIVLKINDFNDVKKIKKFEKTALLVIHSSAIENERIMNIYRNLFIGARHLNLKIVLCSSDGTFNLPPIVRSNCDLMIIHQNSNSIPNQKKYSLIRDLPKSEQDEFIEQSKQCDFIFYVDPMKNYYFLTFSFSEYYQNCRRNIKACR